MHTYEKNHIFATQTLELRRKPARLISCTHERHEIMKKLLVNVKRGEKGKVK